jgi:glycosyltransferase involved in cell wall biosynthesis
VSAVLRVAIFAESYLPYVSGVTVSTEWLARGLGARGHAVLLVAPRPARGADAGSAGGAGPDPAYAWLPSYELPRLAPAGYRMPWPSSTRGALRAAAAFRPDVLHAQSPFVSGRLAARLARARSVPLVFTHHTRFADYGHYLGPLAGAGVAFTDAHLRRFWRACAAVVAPSTDLADEIEARLSGDRRPLVRVIPTGLDTAWIAGLAPLDPRPEAGWPDDAFVVATLGRLAPEKRVELVLEAVALAVRTEPRLRLLVVGGGPSAAVLRRRAEKPDLAGRVRFTGPLPRSEALARLRGADLFAFASDTETQGLVLAEALAAGLPAVALEGPGVRDSVRHELDGVVVPRGRAGEAAPALAEAIRALAADAEGRRRMADRASRDAGRFDTSVRLAQMEALYAELLDRPDR